ncbi:putative secreted protein (Por secretion system target) [Flavobacterium sp. 9]|uniref:M43 family zinc metalloprotease n=1 Tax=Flavobacterium sp. 9 TaxID=2035198 RepID=UPI000C181B4A|nr:M43 family zinc metalloprotease [Flavobacterium sp. 9]PIF30175.1 putative secreted protein (Por secretion system target) [Flavobacterium sp. 9]
MKKIMIVGYSLFSLIFTNLYAQNTNNLSSCASDAMNQKLMKSNSTFSSKMIQFEDMVKKNNLISRNKEQIYVIPVVVHIMHKGESLGTGTNISDKEVFFKIKAINEEFRKIIGSQGDGAGIDVGIEFALAVRNPDNQATNGIVRYDMSGYSNYVNNGINSAKTQGMDDADLKKLSFWDSKQYYNIWLVSEIDNNEGESGVQGYAYYAAQHGSDVDGAVILSNSFKNLESTTEVHEIGHAFNLYHTFEGDNNGLDCPSGNGDFCNDTAPHKRGINDCSIIGNNICDANSSNVFFINNYMSYSYSSCRNMFTKDQKNRIITTLTTIRKSFLESEGNKSFLPVSLPLADFTASSQLINSGDKITFFNFSNGIPNSYLSDTPWLGNTFEWEFTNGTTTLTSDVQNPEVTFMEAGNYQVTLKVTNVLGSGSKKEYKYIQVANATIQPSVPISVNSGNFGYTIHQIRFKDIDNVTDPFLNIAYTDFSTLHKTAVKAGGSYNLEVTTHAGNSGGNPEYHAVYIDYNNDGVFQETERIAEGKTLSNQYGQFIESIIIPENTVPNKLLRMRVAGNGKSPIDNDIINCRVKYWAGDVEDYGVYVIDSEIAPVADFTASASVILKGESISFSDNSSNLPTAWLWKIYKNDILAFSAKEQNPIFTFRESGIYKVELTVGNSGGTDTKYINGMILVNDPLLSTQDDDKITFVYYPNPVLNTLYIRNDLEKIKKVEMYNLSGELVLIQTYNSDTVNVDFSELEKGIYFIYCYQDNSELNFKIIKN